MRASARVHRARRSPRTAVSWRCSLSALAAKGLEGFGDPLTDAFLEKVRGVVEEDGSVVGERGLEALPFAFAEGEVLRSPDDQGWTVGDLRQVGLDLCQVVGSGDQLFRADRGRGTASRVAPGREVEAEHLARNLLREPSSEEDSRNEHQPAIERAAERSTHKRAEHADADLAIERPGKRVADDQPAEELGPTAGEPEPDRSAPVLHHQRQLGQRESIDEALEHRAVLARRETITCRGARHPVARVVKRYTPELVLQTRDDLAVENRPGRVAVQKQDGFAAPFVDVVNASPFEVEEPVLDVEQLARYREGQCHATSATSCATASGFSSEAKWPQRSSETVRTPGITRPFASRSSGCDQSSLP